MAKQCCKRDCNHDGNCDKHPDPKEVVNTKDPDVLDLNDQPGTICVFVQGGLVQDVQGLPHGVKLLVIDYDNDGEEDSKLSKVLLPEADQIELAYVAQYESESFDGAGLTAVQRKAYLASPNHCPFCGSDQIEASNPDFGDGGATEDMKCIDCGERWVDIYTITGVEAGGKGGE